MDRLAFCKTRADVIRKDLELLLEEIEDSNRHTDWLVSRQSKLKKELAKLEED